MAIRYGASRVYGYLACLIALITTIICLSIVVSAAFDLSDPLHAWGDSREVRNLSSVDNFRIDVLGSIGPNQDPPTDESILAMYEAARDATIRTVRLQSTRGLTASGILIVLSIVIFITHWLWLRKIDAPVLPRVPSLFDDAETPARSSKSNKSTMSPKPSASHN